MASFLRPLLASVLSGAGLIALNQQALCETPPRSSSLADLHLEREADEIVADAKCPACLREALSGPCGGAFLLLFRCQNNATDSEIEQGACDQPWHQFSDCYRAHLDYYDERRKLWEEEEADRGVSRPAGAEPDEVDAIPVPITNLANEDVQQQTHPVS